MLSPGKSHVLLACHAWYGDVIGGSFRLASEFAQHIAAEGYQVTYVCCAALDKWEGQLDELVSGVRVLRYLPSAKKQGGMKRLWYHLRQTEQLVTTLHRHTPVDVISGHSPLQALGAARAVRRENIFFNYTVHSPFDDEVLSNSGASVSSVKRRVAAWVAGRVDGRNCALANRVQCDSEYTLAVMNQRHRKQIRDKGVVAPGWVDATLFQPAADQPQLRMGLPQVWQSDVPIFFTLRRLENRMGLETLVAASARLKQEGLHFRTLIGGGGPLQAALERQIDDADVQDRVFLLGRLPENLLVKAYAAADCFVLPTKALECFGLIVLEAFACNTPVIASNVAAIPELAERQGKEWMFEPGNADQLIDRMRDVITRKLKPTVDLRAVAMEYDKARVLKRWQQLLMEPKPGKSQ